MQDAERFAESREALACHPARLLPFRQFRDSGKRRVGSSVHLIVAEPFGERIDRLDQRQLGQVGLRNDAVGMHHLQHAVIQLGLARHVAPLAHG